MVSASQSVAYPRHTASRENDQPTVTKQIATIAMSAQAGINRGPKLQEGLHTTKDPDVMTHSAAFDNYKRHVKAQQSYWYMQSQPGKESSSGQPQPSQPPPGDHHFQAAGST